VSNQNPSSSVPGTEIHLLRILFLSLVAAIGGFLFGFDSGVINGTVNALQVSFQSATVGTGFNVASMLLGCAAGAFFAGALADRLGRKSVLIYAAILFLVSAWGSGVATSSPEFVVYRIIGGLAVGAASMIVPAYISEISPPAMRGRLASLQQLMIVIGLFMAFLSNYLIAQQAGDALNSFWFDYEAWRWMFWMETFPAILFLLLLLFIPESPRYLVAAHKLDAARQVLRHLGSPHPDVVIEEIQSTLSKKHKPRLRDIRSASGIYPIVWVGLGLAILQQMTGINVVFYYGEVLWESAGFTERDALFTNVISGSVNILFTFLAIYLIDKIGRKPLLLVGALGQAVLLAAMAVIFASSSTQTAEGLSLTGGSGLLALIAANGYVAFFALSWGPVMWVMLGEMFPNRFRGAALAICGLAQWCSNFLITITFPALKDHLGLGTAYGFYAFFGLIAFVFVKRYLFETKGKSLEQISRESMGSLSQ
jgi:SP family sugar:H+ symporter-like MFS transporter